MSEPFTATPQVRNTWTQEVVYTIEELQDKPIPVAAKLEAMNFIATYLSEQPQVPKGLYVKLEDVTFRWPGATEPVIALNTGVRGAGIYDEELWWDGEAFLPVEETRQYNELQSGAAMREAANALQRALRHSGGDVRDGLDALEEMLR